MYCLLVYKFLLWSKKPHKTTLFYYNSNYWFWEYFLQGSLKSGVQDAFEGHQKTLGTFAGVAFFCVVRLKMIPESPGKIPDAKGVWKHEIIKRA